MNLNESDIYIGYYILMLSWYNVYVPDLLSIQEYHSLITLLCPDFPFEIVQKTERFELLTSYDS